MDDFSLPGQKSFFGYGAAPRNFIAPGKRPMSSMSPLIVYNKQSKKLVAAVSASGGPKIISAVAQVLAQTLLFNQTIKEAIDMPRLHNQLSPPAMNTCYEEAFPSALVEQLAEIHGHNVTVMEFPFATVQAIVRDGRDDFLTANSDYRRPIYMYPTGY